MKKVSVILPTYNEAGNIVDLIKAILKQLRSIPLTPEIIVVDDNSPDGTAEKVNQLPVKLILRKSQRGLATAIQQGITQSTGHIIVIMDTDFNHQPQDLPRLLKPVINQKADLVIGSRYIQGGGMHASEAGAFQFLASKYGNFLVNRIILGLPIHESLSGFLVFNKKILKKINLNTIFKGYGEYCIRLLYHTYKQGFDLHEIPVVYGKRQYGHSKSRLVKMMIDYFFTALKLRLNGNI